MQIQAMTEFCPASSIPAPFAMNARETRSHSASALGAMAVSRLGVESPDRETRRSTLQAAQRPAEEEVPGHSENDHHRDQVAQEPERFSNDLRHQQE